MMGSTQQQAGIHEVQVLDRKFGGAGVDGASAASTTPPPPTSRVEPVSNTVPQNTTSTAAEVQQGKATRRASYSAKPVMRDAPPNVRVPHPCVIPNGTALDLHSELLCLLKSLVSIPQHNLPCLQGIRSASACLVSTAMVTVWPTCEVVLFITGRSFTQ